MPRAAQRLLSGLMSGGAVLRRSAPRRHDGDVTQIHAFRQAPSEFSTMSDSATRERPRRRGVRGADAVAATLRQVFGLDALRPGQETVINSVLAGHPTLAVMPTGAGKSLCYQLPAVLRPGLTVVVSPLIALMKDQCDKLAELGIPAVQINSAQSSEAIEEAEQAIAGRSARFVFTTPEQLTNRDVLSLLQRAPINLFVIDEAHCISQWGHDFRPAYLELHHAIRAVGSPTLLALTATAPDAVVQDIVDQLHLDDLRVVNLGLFRRNLQLAVEPVTSDAEKLQHVIRLAQERPGPSIVYCATVRHVTAVASALERAGPAAARYHGSLSARVRHAEQERFMQGDADVMVATNAFGMGIDKADIRLVVHYDLPGSPDAYYQEAGRAGRDGNQARAILLFQRADRRLQRFFLGGRHPTVEQFDGVVQVLRTGATQNSTLTVESIRGATGLSAGKLRTVLRALKDEGALRERRTQGLQLVRPVTSDEVRAIGQAYEDKTRLDAERLDRMIIFAQTALCRWRLLLEGLDEPPAWDACGVCDNCQGTAHLATGHATGA